MSFCSQSVIQFHSVSKNFGPKVILSDLTFTISRGQRIAVVGENGAGKTTIAQLAAGLTHPDQGSIQLTVSCRLGYLPQHLTIQQSDLTLKEWLLHSQGDLYKISSRLKELEDQMDLKLEEWCELHQQFVEMDGYHILEKIKKALMIVGLEAVKLDQPFATLSGGEARRAALAALLLVESDLLILDEPTNHVDHRILLWLEEFLERYEGAVLLISHDREFINRVANGIFALDPVTRQLRFYQGNYDAYSEAKRKETEAQKEAFKKQQEEVKSLKKFLKEQTFSSPKISSPKDSNKMAYDHRGERNANAKRKRAAQAKSELEKLEEAKPESVPKDYTGIKFFPNPLKCPYALHLDQVTVKMAGTVLMEKRSFYVTPGERIILQGPNGCGKTTLLWLLASRGQPDEGVIEYANQIKMSYLSQEPEFEDPSLTILAYLMCRYRISEHELRSRLHQIDLIEGRFVKQRIETLSVGQKRRLQILELMLGEANLLLLDEPTNHLAPEVIEQLEKALVSFPGAVIAATHDRRFAQRVGTGRLNWEKGVSFFDTE